MKAAICILLVIGAIFGVYKIWDYYDTVSQQKEAHRAGAGEFNGNSLPGMPYQLDRGLQAAQDQGAKTFKAWLDQNRRLIQDPRLAWIELDLVLSLSKTDVAEAKRLFAAVKKRAQNEIDSASPVHKRIKDLEKTYE